MSLQQKIFNSIENWKLKVIEWKRQWYNYIVSIHNLCIERNNKDGLIVDIYNLQEEFLERVEIEIKSVIEFWSVHNKIFLS